MHPDKKVGLALGILLVGIVGALFFRNESEDPNAESTELASAREIDQQLETRKHKPYFHRADEDRESVDEESDGVEEVLVTDLIPAIPGLDALDGPSAIAAPIPLDELNEADRDVDLVAPLPAPSADGAGVDEALAQAARNRSAELAQRAAKQNANEPDAASASATVHKVVSGDSLSSIAKKYLGSHKRWPELFEANQDVLKDPDSVIVGMQLKIPGRNGVSSSPGGTARSTKPTAKKPDDTKFVQPKRKLRARPPRVSSLTNRRLGQTPPPGLPRVDGIDPTVIASRPGNDEDEKKPEKQTPNEREKTGNESAEDDETTGDE